MIIFVFASLKHISIVKFSYICVYSSCLFASLLYARMQSCFVWYSSKQGTTNNATWHCPNSVSKPFGVNKSFFTVHNTLSAHCQPGLIPYNLGKEVSSAQSLQESGCWPSNRVTLNPLITKISIFQSIYNESVVQKYLFFCYSYAKSFTHEMVYIYR